jgi:hypothetical protein
VLIMSMPGLPLWQSPKCLQWATRETFWPLYCSCTRQILMGILRATTFILVLYIFSGMIIPVVRVAKAQADRVAVTICETTRDCRWLLATLNTFTQNHHGLSSCLRHSDSETPMGRQWETLWCCESLSIL